MIKSCQKVTIEGDEEWRRKMIFEEFDRLEFEGFEGRRAFDTFQYVLEFIN